MPGKVPSTLTNGLLAYWALEEASGSRADSVGSNTLTDVNSVGQASGIIGNAASFVAASNTALTITDNTTLSVGSVSFTISAWFYKNALGSNQFFLSKGTGGGGSTTEYQLNITATNLLQFGTSNGTTAVTLNSIGTITASAWHHVVAWYDSGADTINLRLNNAALRSTAALGRGGYDSGGNFSLGRFHALTTVDWDGRIDEVAFWKRTPTTAEQDELWNGGAGKAYPFS
jgi:hypothetical protein